MHDYELTLIFVPDLTESAIDAILEKFKIKVKEKSFWGRRVLAYPLLPAGRHGKKHKEGIYVMMRVELKSEEVRELEKKLRMEEGVLRYLIVKSQKLKIKSQVKSLQFLL